MKWWDRWDSVIGRAEQALVTVLLSSMILVAFCQIILRNALGTGLSWGDPLVRNLVVWVGFLGAAMATREGKHIGMEVLSRYVPGSGRVLVRAVVHLFSAFVCTLLGLAALRFLANEAKMGQRTFLDIPAWAPEVIIPATFALMALRFGMALCKEVSFFGSSRRGRAPQEGP